MERTLTFKKEKYGLWYVDLPEWTGDKSDLQMVEGADLMLEFMSQGKSEITVRLSDTEFPGADKLIFKRIAEEYGDGAFYILDSYKGVGYGLQIWLCNVTLTVFKNFPETIFILSLEEQIKKHENR